jgi:hypothetical protein
MVQGSSNLHPDVQAFLECLQRVHELLAAAHEQVWSPRILKVIQLAKASDGHSVELFLGYFGGMGSFNDLVLTGSDLANASFDEERTKAYEIAQELR